MVQTGFVLDLFLLNFYEFGDVEVNKTSRRCHLIEFLIRRIFQEINLT